MKTNQRSSEIIQMGDKELYQPCSILISLQGWHRYYKVSCIAYAETSEWKCSHVYTQLNITLLIDTGKCTFKIKYHYIADEYGGVGL